MTRYMLDTNIVGHLLRNHAVVTKHVVETEMAMLCISAVTEGELLFGLAKNPSATRLHRAIREFLRRVDVVSWGTDAAEVYGVIRADLSREGKGIGPLDLLIAAHALAEESILVSNDQAFRMIERLRLADWTMESEA